MPSSLHPRPRSCYTLLGFAAVAVLGILLVVWMPVAAALRGYERDLQLDHAARAAHAVQLAVSRTVEREWASLGAVAARANVDSLGELRSFVDAVPRAGGRIAWAGYADASGTIVAGSDRRREGESVIDRRWFIEGLTQGSVGGAYTPDGIDDRTEPGDVVNMSVPVRDADGLPRGVLVYSLRLDWLAGYAREVASELDVDLFVLGRDGTALIQRVSPGEPPLADATRQAAQLQVARAGLVTGDGDHVFAVLPDLIQGAMPSFGWRLLVRLPDQATGWHLERLEQALWLAAGLAAAMLMLLAVIYARLFLAPLRGLVTVAQGIARGEEAYPPETGLSREAAELSAALALIQDRLDHQPEPAPARPGLRLIAAE